MKHHWTGLAPKQKDYFGFLYLITCKTTGKKYIGKKQFWRVKKGGPKYKSTLVGSDKWKPEYWIESDWATYTGSSNDLNKHIKKLGKENFTFEILGQYASKGDLHYAEIEEQTCRDVLRSKLPDGEREYFNKQIAGIRFIPPECHSEESKKKCNNWKNGHPMSGKQHPNKGKTLPQTGHKKNAGLLWCNDGKTNKKYRVEEGLPEGFVKGQIKRKYTMSDKAVEARQKALVKAREALDVNTRGN